MPKAKVGVSMLYCLGEPFNRMVKRLGTVDTRYVEVLDDGKHELDKKRVAMLKEAAKSYSLEYSLHAPFADINIASPSKSMLDASMKRLKQSMSYANALDAKLWVFHPGAKTGIGQFYPGADWKQNNQSIQELFKVAEELGLNIALENLPAKYYFFMSKAEDFVKFYRETNLPVGIVMDLGHANLEGQIEPFFNMLADKIIHIHASDNDGVEDQHFGIGQGKIDYDWFAQTLKKMGYDKTVILESTTNITESLQKLKQLLS
ncbi:MAG: sugar phosphate isomerase/epimerase [Candidatus Bathyarchaeota archaeon]|nr:sugar phosphate isomerase/epimerase [Candidatus Bathyarchaeota archaeon]